MGEIIMAHQLEQMAYVGETPWHGLGNQLSPHQPIEVWAQQAGMDWRIESSDVSYMAKNDRGQSIILPYEEQRVLYRSDTHAPLSVVSQRFQEVQPKEILEFYRDLTEQSGFELETAGVLKGGKKFWALARTGQSTALKVRMSVMAIFYWQQHVMAHLPQQHNLLQSVWCVTTLWQLPYAMAVPVQAW
jgi:phage/plasmid-like protein (TIGR03299 family)